MAVTRASFLIAFPEFAQAGNALIDAQLAFAEASVSDAITPRDQVVMLLTANNLALTPYGRDARMVGSDGVTTYNARLAELRAAHAVSAARMGRVPS